MCTAWYLYPPHAKARPAPHRKTSFSLLGAAMRLSRCVSLECAPITLERERISGLEVLAQRDRAPHYHRVHPWCRSLPRHAGGSTICGLPGRIRTCLGHADQDVHSYHHRSGGERSPSCRFLVDVLIACRMWTFCRSPS